MDVSSGDTMVMDWTLYIIILYTKLNNIPQLNITIYIEMSDTITTVNAIATVNPLGGKIEYCSR